MKRSITFKITLCFTIVLICFSLVLSIVFMNLSQNQILESHTIELQKKAEEIAQVLSGLLCTKECKEKVGDLDYDDYEAYLYFINDIASTHVWIIDAEGDIVARGRKIETMDSYYKMPPNTEEVIKEGLQGKKGFKRGVGKDDRVPTITVAEPIIGTDCDVLGVVLLHHHIDEMDSIKIKILKALLISILITLILSMALAIYFSFYLTKPLKKMKDVSLVLAEGNYDVKTNIMEEDEIGELANSLDILSDKLKKASEESEKLEQLRRDFISNISHELRTPITVMRGSLELLSKGIIKEESKVKEYHKEMLCESVFLQTLVNDLLELSKLENPDFPIKMEKLNLCEVFQEVLRIMRRIGESKGVSLIYESDCIVYEFEGDYVRLRQMITTVLDNSIKFSKEGQTIEISFIGGVLSIINHGDSITSEDLPHIFNKFYKIHNEKNKSGSGLGLAICKEIAERHDISVEVHSRSEETRFKFIFSHTRST